MKFRFPFGCAAVFAIAFAAGFMSEASFAAPSESLAPDAGSPSSGAKAGRWLEARAATKKPAAKDADAKKAGKPQQVEKYGEWGVFVAQGVQGGKDKTCYALASPKERAPAGLKRDPAYVFISNGPGADIRGEVSIILGFAAKEDGDARAEVGGSSVELVAKGASAWIKNLAKQAQFVEAMKNGSKLVVKAPSVKGNATTDTYSLSGLSQALERVQKECP